MSKKLVSKLKVKEDKLMDAIYEIQELLDATEDAELSSMGNEFCDAMIDFISSNGIMTLNEIREFIEEQLE
jgi:hypothetical protein